MNFYRKVFHLFFGVFLWGLSYVLSYKTFSWVLVGLLIASSLFEILRLFLYDYLPLKRIWIPLLKKEEFYKISDGWFYLVGITCLYGLVGIQDFRLVVLVLTLADPMASLVGFYIGRIKVFSGKTLEGGVTFLLITLFIVYTVKRSLTLVDIGFSTLLAFTELLTKRDNFWIPLIGGLYLRYFKG
ncbi:hypothetical protein F1847_02055 [Thermodesulfobacterium sp. TA1]|uniref:hypothetical protein n=1 Tax=Thermodesulfobacterium sp. TA1 TaxID=2234087 RepID=UPI001232D6DB|nr:hypothetical protein [Thermodesulfobacterium sp. TA1]QER41583.1 hypothetical protein F1847_02055 [Thermodesulfobacterium sp. TA1]